MNNWIITNWVCLRNILYTRWWLENALFNFTNQRSSHWSWPFSFHFNQSERKLLDIKSTDTSTITSITWHSVTKRVSMVWMINLFVTCAWSWGISYSSEVNILVNSHSFYGKTFIKPKGDTSKDQRRSLKYGNQPGVYLSTTETGK